MTTKPEDALVAELLSLKAFLEAHHCNADAITTLLERATEARFDDLIRGFKAGALAVHENWQEDRDPDFTEAAHDYANAALAEDAG